jgi:hypothetical protein
MIFTAARPIITQWTPRFATNAIVIIPLCTTESVHPTMP